MGSKGNQFHAVGKRKTAIARVFLKEGNGEILINGKGPDEYFGRASLSMISKRALVALDLLDKVDVKVNVCGGGVAAQAGAVLHGIARALLVKDEGNKRVLRSEGFLTRDAREVERKKPGRHKARKRPQFSKR